jgi:hypothetical protein
MGIPFTTCISLASRAEFHSPLSESTGEAGAGAIGNADIFR